MPNRSSRRVNPRYRSAHCKYEGADEIEHEQKRHRGLLLITGRKGRLRLADVSNNKAKGAAPTTRPAPRQQEFKGPSAMSDG